MIMINRKELLKLIYNIFFIKEIMINILSFLFAGFDTTAGTLGFCMYILINHPEEMRKIQDELSSFNTVSFDIIIDNIFILFSIINYLRTILHMMIYQS